MLMLLKKVELAKSDIYLALLDHPSTPTEQTNVSPAQRLFSHRAHTLLPMSTKLLKSNIHPSVKDKLLSAQDRHANYYNKISWPLPEIQRYSLCSNVTCMSETTWGKHLI